MFLPALGCERSFFLLAVLYGGIGVLLAVRHAAPRAAVYGGAAVLLVSLALFPFGTMETRLLETPCGRGVRRIPARVSSPCARG